MSFSQVAGILPAVVFPAATAFQLVQIVRQRAAAGVSPITWALFGCANVAMYVYAERYTEWQSIVGLLVTALLDFGIAALALSTILRARRGILDTEQASSTKRARSDTVLRT